MNAIETPEQDLPREAGHALRHVGRPPARHASTRALTAPELESRKLIHRESPVRECTDAFRQIRTRLLALSDKRNFVTLVVPVSPRSGASFVARNLAAAFAFSDTMSALLIDCSLNHPAQDQAFGVQANTGGLMDYLGDPDCRVDDVVYATGVPRLRLVPAGHGGDLAGEHFSSLRMQAMIAALRGRCSDRTVILDGPAVKGSPDARILSQLADFVIVVAGYGRDTPAAITAATGHFEAHKLAGVVFDYAS